MFSHLGYCLEKETEQAGWKSEDAGHLGDPSWLFISVTIIKSLYRDLKMEVLG